VTRRMQLLASESRSSGRRVSMVFGRIRDGLLRDNKVVPAVLGILALLIFAWLIAGAFIGGLGGGEEEQQASNQASLAQADDSDSGDSETPAPGVDNRDADSYAAFDEPKDPFALPKGLGGKDSNGSTDGGQGNSRGNSQGSNQNDRNGGDRNGGSTSGGRGNNGQGSGTGSNGTGRDASGNNSEGFMEQRSPGEPGFQGAPGGGQGGAGQGSGAQGGAEQAGAGQDAGLFNSGGDLPMP
jgi:hypothetical protein